MLFNTTHQFSIDHLSFHLPLGRRNEEQYNEHYRHHNQHQPSEHAPIARMTVRTHHQATLELLVVLGRRAAAMLLRHDALRPLRTTDAAVVTVVRVRTGRIGSVAHVARLRVRVAAVMPHRRVLARTVADVRPHHVEDAHDQDAELNDERIQVRRDVAVDVVQHVRPGALVLDVRVLLDVARDANGIGRLRDNRVDPHGHRGAQRVHQHHARQAAVLVDDDVHVLEDEEEHEQRVGGEQDVHGQRDVGGAELLLAAGEEDDLVGDLQDGVDEQAECEPWW